jgi:branched-chain amino acid transport system ATP-binding protein
MTATTTTAALSVAGLGAGYGRFDVIRDLDLHVAPGEAVGLVGPNGAGKTTVLRAVMGMIKHRRGTIRVGETDVSSLPTHRIARGHAALVPEGRRLFSELSVEDNLLLGGMNLRDAARTQELLASVFALFPVLERYRERPSTALSGGEQQMVAVARGLISRPDVLIVDEPALGLAPSLVDEVYTRLTELATSTGITIVLLEQLLGRAMSVSHKVVVLRDGVIVATGSPDDDAFAQTAEEAYFGDIAKTLIEAEV